MATSGSAGGTYVPNFTDFNKLKVRNEAQNHKNAYDHSLYEAGREEIYKKNSFSTTDFGYNLGISYVYQDILIGGWFTRYDGLAGSVL